LLKCVHTALIARTFAENKVGFARAEQLHVFGKRLRTFVNVFRLRNLYNS